MSDGNNLSIVAIAVALVALIVALGQLCGQYFATADGYRRCQASVMGPWAKFTRLRWRWSQFRFETLFTSPEILFIDYDKVPTNDLYTYKGKASGKFLLMIAANAKLFVSPDESNSKVLDNDELVCWVSLLHSLYTHQMRLGEAINFGRSSTGFSSRPHVPYAGPVVRLRERSWDFVPPEVVRPVAVTSVSCIAVIACRLGMTWIDFRPEENIMRAEGNGHVLNSTLVRSMGIVLQYMRVEDAPYTPILPLQTYIPTREADMMGFGILPVSKFLYIGSRYKIGTIEEILAVMNHIDPSGHAREVVQNTYNVGKKPFGFSDLISMAAPMMHIKGSNIMRVPVPADHCDGLTSYREGFVIFHERLKQHIDLHESDQEDDKRKWVLARYEVLKSTSAAWEDENLAMKDFGKYRDKNFLTLVHDCFDETTKYFEYQHDKYIEFLTGDGGLHYNEIVYAHLVHAVRFWGDATRNMREGKARFDSSWMRDWAAEGAHLYWDYLPSIRDWINNRHKRKNKPVVPAALIDEAWIMLMFRGFCWWRSHWMDLSETRENSGKAKTRLPSRYWDSKFQVYIG